MEAKEVVAAIFTLVAILFIAIILSNVACKSGRGVGIMHGGMSNYRYIEVPAELQLQNIEYEFTPSNGYVNVKWEPRNSK